MHYKESQKILQSIKAAKNILISSHKEPDADSIGSILGFAIALKKLNKNITLAIRDEVPEYLSFLKHSKSIKKVDFADFNLSKFDLIFALDSSRWDRIVGTELGDLVPQMPVIVIDHHMSNLGYGNINIIDKNSTSTSEIVYKLLYDFKIALNKEVAESILTGMIGDTGSFRYPGLSSETFSIASDLLKIGADRDKINFELYFNTEFSTVKYLSVILDKAVLDKKYKIVWSAVPYDIYHKFGEPDNTGFAGAFFQTIKDTELGVLMIEKEKNTLDVSLRSRRNIEASKITMELGGGGHKKAAGAKIKDLEFDKAVKKVLSIVKKYTRN